MKIIITEKEKEALKKMVKSPIGEFCSDEEHCPKCEIKKLCRLGLCGDPLFTLKVAKVQNHYFKRFIPLIAAVGISVDAVSPIDDFWVRVLAGILCGFVYMMGICYELIERHYEREEEVKE